MDTFPPPPPPPAEYAPSHWKRHKGKYLIAAAAVVGLGIIGAAAAPDDEEAAPVEAPATTEAVAETTEAPEPTAPATTEAPTTTRAPAPPPPPPAPEESLADLVEDLWYETAYCYTDCTNAYSAQEWVDRAERYGRIDTDSFVTGYEYLDAQPYGDIDAVCDEFWVMADDDVADLALDANIDPAAWVLNMYLWCDS